MAMLKMEHYVGFHLVIQAMEIEEEEVVEQVLMSLLAVEVGHAELGLMLLVELVEVEQQLVY